ncbi:MAG: phenylalanyl-tRNA synthetase beta chain, partial [Actinomycetota bacterium]|nr:phenylalanyl-tRNA synthetase beta chain [Actinomycetota bacterium]
GDGTTSVILEAAYFDPGTIARTSRRLGLRSEASARFERGADPEAPPYAAARCAQLISEVAGGQPAKEIVDEYPSPIERRTVRLRPARTTKVLGFDLSSGAQAGHLRSVDLEVDEHDGVLEVKVPTFRPDIEREVDLIEEVARLAGLDHLQPTLPKGIAGGLERIQVAERTLSRALAGLGLHEAWTSSLTNRGDLELLGLAPDHPARRVVPLMNPMSEQENVMRSTLLPGLLRSAARSISYRVEDVALYEIARIYDPNTDQRLPLEPLVLGCVFTGRSIDKGWAAEAVPWNFFEAKGAIASAFASLGVVPETAASEGMPFHPSRTATVAVSGKVIGSMGELHPSVCDRFDVPEGTVVAEIALGPVFDAMPGKVKVSELPRFPAALIDLAVIVDDACEAGRVQEEIASAGGPELVDVRLFDLYRGEQVPSGKKSLAYALRLQVADRTLTDQETAAVVDRIMSSLQERFGAELRG